MRVHGGWVVDATEVRGYAACVNAARQGANLIGYAMTIHWPKDQCFFAPPERSTGLCAVIASRHMKRRNPFFARGGRYHWRRIPQIFLRPPFSNQSFVWYVAKKNIPAGTELLVDYANEDLLAIEHETKNLLEEVQGGKLLHQGRKKKEKNKQ